MPHSKSKPASLENPLSDAKEESAWPLTDGRAVAEEQSGATQQAGHQRAVCTEASRTYSSIEMRHGYVNDHYSHLL